MAIDLSNKDLDLMNRYLNAVLDRYRDGRYELATARSELAHVITMIAKDDADFVVHIHSVLEDDADV